MTKKTSGHKGGSRPRPVGGRVNPNARNAPKGSKGGSKGTTKK
jgi:hypothetical protein